MNSPMRAEATHRGYAASAATVLCDTTARQQFVERANTLRSKTSCRRAHGPEAEGPQPLLRRNRTYSPEHQVRLSKRSSSPCRLLSPGSAQFEQSRRLVRQPAVPAERHRQGERPARCCPRRANRSDRYGNWSTHVRGLRPSQSRDESEREYSSDFGPYRAREHVFAGGAGGQRCSGSEDGVAARHREGQGRDREAASAN